MSKSNYTKKIVTIHQPDFMPWLGLFVKINKADTFVVLDNVINKYNAQNWLRRVKLSTKLGSYWLTVTVQKSLKSSFVPINKMKINKNIDYSNALETIRRTYAKAEYFNDIYPLVENWFNSEEELLSKRNINFIIDIMNRLEISTEIVYVKSLSCKGKSNELLIEILKSQNADIYLCGDGAGGYQKNEMYLEHGIEVEYNNFKSKEYKQVNTKKFEPNLSIIDALMNIGVEGTKKLIKEMSLR
ncbi:hypothetical protein MNB_SV-12-2013 [hydrothermal vent metagenome]|uniref:WbqC-like protein family n=1 Tax=hydrothermal vent metagenome TaxID=652676 RepID=A0A1W1BUI8_9ZZZZ